MSKYKTILILLSIFSLSLFLHLYRLDLLPLYSDETFQYLLLQRFLATNQNIFVSLYNKVLTGTLSFTWLFGLSPLGVRFSSALFSSVSAVALYLLATSVSKKKSVGYVSALLASLIPWLFMLSRIGHSHVILLVLFVTIQTYFFLNSSKIWDYILSLFFLGLAILIYPSMVFIAPAIGLVTMIYLCKLLNRKQRLWLLFISVPLLIFLGIGISYHFKIFDPGGRGLDLAIWNDVNTTWETDKFRALSWTSAPSIFSFNLPPEQLVNKLFANRATANLSVFTKNYLSYFSPDWLFLKGDAILRHSTGMVGTFYLFLMPFMLYGSFRFFQTADKKKRITFLIWILFSPIPAAITKDGAGYLLRVVTMLPFLTYFSAFGIVESFSLISKKWRWSYGLVIVMIGLYSAWSFFYGYFHVYPSLAARSFESGFKELSDFQVNHQNAPMLIIWDGYYHNGDFRFWQKTPFDQYKSFARQQLVFGESTFWQTFPNLYFSSPKSSGDLRMFLKKNPVMYVVLPDRYFVKYPLEIENLLDPVEQIMYSDQTTALSIYTPK